MCLLTVFSHCYDARPDLPSFPTRRSSDLPFLKPRFYSLDSLDLDEALHAADVVMVHEWNDHELVRRIGQQDRKSTRLNSSHLVTSYAVFCLKKKKEF